MLWHSMISMINKDIKNLTGVSHKGFNCFRSVLCSSHFLVPLPLLIHKILLESYEEDIKQISPGTTNHHNPSRDFCRQSIKRVSIHFYPLAIWCNRWHSLWASSPIWASEASRGRTRERAAKRVTLARLLFTISPEWRACSQATAYMKQFQCRNIVLNNKTGPLFLEFNWCKD